MSLPREHPPLKWMSNFKAVAIDYEFYLSLSDEPQSVCLTERQMYVLSVQNTYTYWLTRWYNTDDITQKTVEFIAAEIEGLLVMCNCGVPALTPTDVFNTTNYVNTTTAIYNTTQNTWYEGDETVISIAPHLDYDTGDPVDISKLICFAIDMLIKSILAQGKTMNESTAAQNTNLMNVISSAMSGLSTAGAAAALIGGVAASAVAFFGGPWMLLGLALGAVGVKIATLFMGADNSLFENSSAIANVICAAQNNLNDKQVDRAAFMAALTPLGYDPGTPEAQLAAMIQPFLDDLDTYLQFMVLGNQLYSKVTFALMPDCGCDVGPRFLLINGLPDIFMLQTQTFIERDGDWDIWDIVSGAFQGAPYSPPGSGPYYYGTNFKEEHDLCIDAESISGMVWQQSNLCGGGSVSAATFSPNNQQIGTYSSAATTLRVKVKLST